MSSAGVALQVSSLFTAMRMMNIRVFKRERELVRVEDAEDKAESMIQNVERPDSDALARFRDEGSASCAVDIVFQVDARIGDA